MILSILSSVRYTPISELLIFCCACYSHSCAYCTNKLLPKIIECFLGIQCTSQMCLDCNTGRVCISRHVCFNEHHFPCHDNIQTLPTPSTWAFVPLYMGFCSTASTSVTASSIYFSNNVSCTFNISYTFCAFTSCTDSSIGAFFISNIFYPGSSSPSDCHWSSRWYQSSACSHRWDSVISVITCSFSLTSYFYWVNMLGSSYSYSWTAAYVMTRVVNALLKNNTWVFILSSPD